MHHIEIPKRDCPKCKQVTEKVRAKMVATRSLQQAQSNNSCKQVIGNDCKMRLPKMLAKIDLQKVLAQRLPKVMLEKKKRQSLQTNGVVDGRSGQTSSSFCRKEAFWYYTNFNVECLCRPQCRVITAKIMVTVGVEMSGSFSTAQTRSNTHSLRHQGVLSCIFFSNSGF